VGPSHYHVINLTSSPPVSIQAQGSGNQLQGPNSQTSWSITGPDRGTLDGVLTFQDIGALAGGSGLNMFVLSDGATLSGALHGGGGGHNWLDYAAYTTSVAVDLATGAAKGIAGGITGIRNVRGGQGGNQLIGNALGNILIGGAGTNTITGGKGRSILIGGAGQDMIAGNSGSDILIAGYTDYDLSSVAHDLALAAILAEWQSGNPYQTRIQHIKFGGGFNGSDKLVWGAGGTVHDNPLSQSNVLTGGGLIKQNWFFCNPSHTQTNRGTQQLN
jgi:Ca2+-binding RTX toxin-like protein